MRVRNRQGCIQPSSTRNAAAKRPGSVGARPARATRSTRLRAALATARSRAGDRHRRATASENAPNRADTLQAPSWPTRRPSASLAASLQRETMNSRHAFLGTILSQQHGRTKFNAGPWPSAAIGTASVATTSYRPLRNEGRMERAKRFELSTPTLARLCSTPELRPHAYLPPPDRMAAARSYASGGGLQG